MKKTPFDEASINARVQRQRKVLGLEVSERIAIQVTTASEPLKLMLQEHDAKRCSR